MRHRHAVGGPSIQELLRISAWAVLTMGGGCAAASESATAVRHRIEQPAQPLVEALRAIARQTGSSVLFDANKLGGMRNQPLSGKYSAVEAVRQAIAGSELTVEVTADRSIVVRRSSAPPSSPPSAPRRESSADGAMTPVLLAQASPALASDAGQAGSAAVEVHAGQRIEVTGSRLRRIDGDTALPVNVYGRQDIERSGQPSLVRFLTSLNEASVSVGEGSWGVTQGQGAVQLRGLPLGTTLVLINGRRVQAVGSSTGNFFNLSLIPLEAVERVEVVPVGSSAVYGGDALAGVVNVILKKGIDGAALGVRLASGRGTGDGGVSLTLGSSSPVGDWQLLASFSRTSPLTTEERAFFADDDYRRFGGLDARHRFCTPGTVTSATTANLPGLNSTVAGIPSLSPGEPLTLASFAASAGQPNLCSGRFNSGAALVYGNASIAIHAAGQRQLTPGLSLFGEATHVRDEISAAGGGLRLNNVLVPASNAYNPFGVAVRVTTTLSDENGVEGFVRNSNFTRVLAGLRGEWGRDWDFETSLSTTRDNGDRLTLRGTTDANARTAALASSNPALALNPFASGRAAAPAVIDSIWSDAPRVNAGRRDQVGGFVRGPVAALPAGRIEAIVGLEAARDVYDARYLNVHDDNSRRSTAVFGELRLPLWAGASDGSKSRRIVDLTLAGRRDRYSDFGAADTYQAGLEWRPARSLLLRASGATSFKPPTLVQTGKDEIIYPIELANVRDPARNREPLSNGEWISQTNPALRPETGKAFSVGALWEPATGGPRLGITAWRVEIKDLIALLLPQIVVDNEGLFPEAIVREPSVGGVPGRITRLYFSEVNFGVVQTSGLDMEVSQAWASSLGKLSLAGSATRVSKYAVAIAPGAATESRLGRRYQDYWAPAWKGRLSAGLDRGPWSVSLTSRYLGRYKDAGTSTRTLGDFWVHDLGARIDLLKLGAQLGPAKAASLSLGVVNVGNRLPEYTDAVPNFENAQGDWRGRYFNVRLSVDW